MNKLKSGDFILYSEFVTHIYNSEDYLKARKAFDSLLGTYPWVVLEVCIHISFEADYEYKVVEVLKYSDSEEVTIHRSNDYNYRHGFFDILPDRHMIHDKRGDVMNETKTN